MRHVALAIGTSAVPVIEPGAGGVLIQADAGNTADIYLGATYVTADATATGGVRLSAGMILPAVITGNDRVWAVAPSGSQTLRLIYQTDDSDLTGG